MTKKEADIIYIAAQKMSNWLYNLSQKEEFKKYSAAMREMVQEWDDNKIPLAKASMTKKRQSSAIKK